MSLTVILSAAIASDRSTFTITDVTVYGTRSNYYVYLGASKMNYSNIATALTVDNSLPHTVSSWSISYSNGDGWYRMYFVALQAYAGGTTYAKYDSVYSSGIVYRSLQAGNIGHSVSDTSWWEVISDVPSLAANKGESNESLNIDSLIYNRNFGANGQNAFDNLVSGSALCSDCDESALLARYNLLALWLDALSIADAREETLQGELIARRVQSSYIDCVPTIIN